MRIIKYISALFLVLGLIPLDINAQDKSVITVKTDEVVRSYNKTMLLGTNAGVFYKESYLMNPKLINKLLELKPGIIRIPGGTWSNEIYWNGNGVRKQRESYIEKDIYDSIMKTGGNPLTVAFDTTKYDGQKWDIDYSGYAPGFRTHGNEQTLTDYHGFTDVLFLHKWIQSLGTETMVTVNMGTGDVETAVEWLKWTKQRKNYALEPFDVKYWEMGNELDGHWEQGFILPDGTEMNGKEYTRRYKEFANAMKKADPSVKVGGSTASSMQLKFIEDILKDTECPIDFISFHTYPSRDNDTDFVKMANHAAEINDATAKIRNWIAKYRPEQVGKIEIALTEWNIKVKEDITTVDLTNTLWSTVMLGEIAKSGVDIAIQWDMFSTTETGGHGLFNPTDKNMTPRSQYWALYLWANFMGDKLVDTKIEGSEYIRSFTTTNDKYVSVMIINGSKENSETVELKLTNLKGSNIGKEISFSEDQFLLDTQTLLPLKSEKPSSKDLKLKKKNEITVKPYSIKIIRYLK